jgi:hypothetical protein
MRVLDVCSVTAQRSELMVAPVNTNSDYTEPLTSKKTGSMTAPAECAVLNCLSDGEKLWQFCIECTVLSDVKRCTQLSSPVTKLHKNLSPSRSYRNKNNTQAHWLLFQFLSVHKFRYYPRWAIRLYSLLRNGWFYLLLPAKKCKDLPWRLLPKLRWASSGDVRGFPPCCMLLRLLHPSFASRTREAQSRAILTSTWTPPQTTPLADEFQTVKTSFAVKNSITALFHSIPMSSFLTAPFLRLQFEEF